MKKDFRLYYNLLLLHQFGYPIACLAIIVSQTFNF